MNNVYLLTTGWGDDLEIAGAFSTMEKLRGFTDCNWLEEIDIRVLEVDGLVDQRAIPFWRARLDLRNREVKALVPPQA